MIYRETEVKGFAVGRSEIYISIAASIKPTYAR